ncbi:hypothetical protein BJ912DRAFT_478888 [Pholiota molesta]|nr:hypothetical protein BJ912DRAFT_478888 [Pholiota molesta]
MTGWPLKEECCATLSRCVPPRPPIPTARFRSSYIAASLSTPPAIPPTPTTTTISAPCFDAAGRICNLLALSLARLLRQPNPWPRITIPKNIAAGDRVRRCNTPRASSPPNTLLDNGSSIAGASNGAMASHRRRRPPTRHGRRQRVQHCSPPREAHVKASGRSQAFLAIHRRPARTASAAARPFGRVHRFTTTSQLRRCRQSRATPRPRPLSSISNAIPRPSDAASQPAERTMEWMGTYDVEDSGRNTVPARVYGASELVATDYRHGR